MMDLPDEVWSLIAEGLLPRIPAPRAEVNWTEHLNQGDILALQRVSKRMYAIVTPVLYREPIVQDLGLFLRGIEMPLPAGTTPLHPLHIGPDESIPVHKLHALALVRKLHLINASSSNLVTPQMKSTNKFYEFANSELCQADVLGRADLDGWKDANIIIAEARKTHGEAVQTFIHVEHLTLGLWDDGRWAKYGVGSKDIKTVIHDLARCLDIIQSKHLCRRSTRGVYSRLPPNIGTSTSSEAAVGISIFHATSLRDIRLYDSHPGPVRVYANIGVFEPYLNTLVERREADEPFKSYDWILYPIHPIRASVAKGTLVEICIVAKNSWRRVGQVEMQMQLDLAVNIKAALEKFHEEVVKRKGKARLWGGDVRILVGDDVPVCPCCGST